MGQEEVARGRSSEKEGERERAEGRGTRFKRRAW